MKLPLLALAAAVLSGSPALADNPAAAAREVASPFGAVARMAGSDLATVTGRDDTSLAVRAQNSANVSNNSVNGPSQTGTISFDSQSFQNLNGLSLLSANTGNNVSINASLNVNVAIQR